MKLFNIFVFSAGILLASQPAQAVEADFSALKSASTFACESDRAAILAPVQAAYDFHQAEAARAQNAMDAIEDELHDPALTAERKQTLTVALAALRAKEAVALARLQAESALAQSKMLALGAPM